MTTRTRILLFASAILLLFTWSAEAQRSGARAGADSGGDDDASKTATGSVMALAGSDLLQDLEAWRHEKVREALEAVEKGKSRDAAWQTAWAMMLAQERELDAAIVSFQTVIAAEKKDPAPPLLLGDVLSWKKDRDGAASQWTTARDRALAALEDNPEDSGALYVLGAALLRLEKPEQAIQKLRKAKKHGANPVLCAYQIGIAQSYLQSWKDAIATFSEVIEADDGFAHAYYYRGRAHKKNDRTDLMIQDLKRFVALAPDAREATAARALIEGAGG